MVHGLKLGAYRKQFGIPSTQILAAKSYSESRRQMAIDKGLGEDLAKFRAKKVGKKTAVSVKTDKTLMLVVKAKQSIPAIRKNAAVPSKSK